MALRISEADQLVKITKREYWELLRAYKTLIAIKNAEIEEGSIYKAVHAIQYILDDDRVEFHIKPTPKRYK